MRYVRILCLMLVGVFLLPMLAFAQDTLAAASSTVDTLLRPTPLDQGFNFASGILAILIPVITGYLTKFLVNVMKNVDAFGESNPLIKQLASFVIAFILSWIAGHFGSTDVSVILNTVIGGALAQVFYNGKKISEVAAPVARST